MKTFTLRLIIVALLFSYATLSFTQSIENDLTGKIDIIVSQDGSGDYETIQEAIDAVTDNNSSRTVVFIRNGVYYEKVIVPYTKINITLIGEDVDSTIITYDDNPATTSGNSFGTHSVSSEADNFCAINITFENSSGDVGQALAYSADGDKQMFYHCRFLGWQDTYFINFRCRNYMKDCLIEGSVDYIYGYGIGVYDSCQIHTIRSGGVITAAASSAYNRFGLTFRDCRLTSAVGVSGISLGRPWQSKPHVAYLTCYEPSTINTEGWSSMSSGKEPIFAEYNCTGPGFKPTSRSTNLDYPGIQLTAEQASKYILDTIFAAASFADQDQDTTEEREMYQPFDDADLHDLIMEVMKRGRDTFPEIPADDWNPMIDTNQLIQVVKANFLPFLDSSYSQEPVLTGITVGGEELTNFSADKYLYGVEVPEGDTVAPIIGTSSVNSDIKIAYPNSLPGYSGVYVYSRDHVVKKTYNIFNSVDSAYWDATIKFLGYNNADTIDLIPGVFEYDVIVDESIPKITGYQIVRNTLYSKQSYVLPSAIPGTGTITITALEGTIENEYTLNFMRSTPVNEFESHQGGIQILNPVTDQGLLSIAGMYNGILNIKIFDASGRFLESGFIEICESDNLVPFNFSSLTEGLYFYQIHINNEIFNGKMIKVK